MAEKHNRSEKEERAPEPEDSESTNLSRREILKTVYSSAVLRLLFGATAATTLVSSQGCGEDYDDYSDYSNYSNYSDTYSNSYYNYSDLYYNYYSNYSNYVAE